MDGLYTPHFLILSIQKSRARILIRSSPPSPDPCTRCATQCAEPDQVSLRLSIIVECLARRILQARRLSARAGKSAEWNRGAYLVQGLGHCNACHAERNPLGATAGDDALGGGQIMGSNWYAPSLTSRMEAGFAHWRIDEIVQLLTTGVSPQATTSGPMAQVVMESLQHLTKEDARAMAVYLQSLPETNSLSLINGPAMTEQVQAWFRQGATIYEKHCQDCHGASGQGAPGVYPPLANNRSITMTPPINAIRSVLNGGYPPATRGNPRPYGMPPFAQTLHDGEVALVLSYIRNAWGNHASLVTTAQVDKSREGITLK